MRHEIRGYDEVRAAARDFETYSSNLLGDRDVRTYRQLPLEADPPRHTKFREAVQPLFMSEAVAVHRPAFQEHARRLMKQIREAGGGDIVSDFALPYVIACLTTIYKRPQDFEEWLSWGPDVWTAETHREKAKRAAEGLSSEDVHDVRSGTTLQRYLDSVFDAAETNRILEPEKQDVWDFVSQLVVDGAAVNREEMQGIANVLLAGGRDTVIKLICGLVWHLIGHPEDREFLASNPQWFNRTIAEMVRYLSPLPKMERALADQAALADDQRDPDKYVLLNFVSANYDRNVWPDAEVINIHRERKPHLAFGFGRHSCLGMNVTEHEVGALLGVLLTEWPDWKFASDPSIEWARDEEAAGMEIRYISRFDRLEVKI